MPAPNWHDIARRARVWLNESFPAYSFDLVWVPLPERAYRWLAITKRVGPPWARRSYVSLLATSAGENIPSGGEMVTYRAPVGGSVSEALEGLLLLVNARRTAHTNRATSARSN